MAAASKVPGQVTTVGYGTMADPKRGGWKINCMTKEDLVVEFEVLDDHNVCLPNKNMPDRCAAGAREEIPRLQGRPYQRRHHPRHDRGPHGQRSDGVREPLRVNHVQAMAARASDGIVFCQTECVATENSLRPRDVRTPCTLVSASWSRAWRTTGCPTSPPTARVSDRR